MDEMNCELYLSITTESGNVLPFKVEQLPCDSPLITQLASAEKVLLSVWLMKANSSPTKLLETFSLALLNERESYSPLEWLRMTVTGFMRGRRKETTPTSSNTDT